MGFHFCHKCARAVFDVQGGVAAVAQRAWQNHQFGIAWRGASVGGPCTLLLIKSRIAHAHQSYGESISSGDSRKLCCARNDRSGGAIGCKFYEAYGRRSEEHTSELQSRVDIV